MVRTGCSRALSHFGAAQSPDMHNAEDDFQQEQACRQAVKFRNPASVRVASLHRASRKVSAAAAPACAQEEHQVEPDDVVGINTQTAAEAIFMMQELGTPASPATPAAPAVPVESRSKSRKRKLEAIIQKDGYRQRNSRHRYRVLFSRGLPDDVKRRQTKLLHRLGGVPASEVRDCTHFVTDKFIRSINMLEAMASGKAIVTVSWLESSAGAGTFLDEGTYLLQDLNKEEELGFSMRSTLAAARKQPLLLGMKVGVTPSVQPPKEAVLSVVSAAGGKGTGPRGKDLSFLVSCDADYEVCKPLIQRGVKVYSVELLLHGIVTHHLDLSKFRLFLSR